MSNVKRDRNRYNALFQADWDRNVYTVGANCNFKTLQDAFNFISTSLVPLTIIPVTGTFDTTQYSDNISITGGNLVTAGVRDGDLFTVRDDISSSKGNDHWYPIHRILSETDLILDSGIFGLAQTGLSCEIYRQTSVTLLVMEGDYENGGTTNNTGYRIPNGFDISIIGSDNTFLHGDGLVQQQYGTTRISSLTSYSSLVCGGYTNEIPLLNAGHGRLYVNNCNINPILANSAYTNQRQTFNGASFSTTIIKNTNMNLVDHGSIPTTDLLYLDNMKIDNPTSWECLTFSGGSSCNRFTKRKYIKNVLGYRYGDQSASGSQPANLVINYGLSTATKSPVQLIVENSHFYDDNINHAGFSVVSNASNVINTGLAHTYTFINSTVDYNGTHGAAFTVNGTAITVNQRNTLPISGAAYGAGNAGTSTYNVS